jgi:multiple sugar transport system ATP-binding protein
VTHDQVEAMTMGDRVAVLKDGLLQQCDTPRRMYDHPDNVFVAGFIGSPAMNLLESDLSEGGVRIGDSVMPVDRTTLSQANGAAVTLGVRPEDLKVNTEGAGLPVTVEVVEELGADAYIYGVTPSGDAMHPIIARVDGRRPPRKGEVVHLVPEPHHVHLFDKQTGERLGG